MLIAKNKYEQVIRSDEANREDDFYCPCCKGEVILKKGSIKYPHFAHKSLTTCIGYSENETFEHLQGKLLIAKNCEIFGISYELEAYMPQFKQRADVLINGHIAIEFQCSSLSIERLKERTRQYQHHGYQVFWIWGKRLGSETQLTELKKHGIYFDTVKGYVDYCLLVESSQLVVTYYLLRDTKRVVTKTETYSLLKINLLESLRKVTGCATYLCHRPLEEMEIRKKSYTHLLYRSEKRVMSIQSYLYQESLHLLYLSSYIYLPNVYHPLLKGEDIVIRTIVLEYLKVNPVTTYDEIKHAIVGKLPIDMIDDYSQLGPHQLIDYCLSLYLNFLEALRMIKITESKIIYFKEVNRMTDEQLKNFFKKKSERLTLPLKYDMIMR